MFSGSLLENSTLMGSLGGLYPGQPGGDLSSCEVTLLNQLNERRDSTTSTLSSACSRRSSGISPCYSSRRSSEASQFGANRHNNISSADSYDPISTDMSRRSSEASHCGGGGPSLLSLTPAQHYRLKAKYAAATGGAPPTPLPNMDRMSLRTRMALYGESQDGSSPLFHLPPTGAVPRRCSDTGYASQSMMPHEIPANLTRRASDPVRRPALDPLSFSRVQRYNSMNNMNPMSTPSAAERHRTLATQAYTRSDGSLQRYPFAPRPPSISENVAMENMAVDGAVSAEDDMVLPDDVVQYLRSQNSGASGHNYNPNNQTQGYHASMAPPPTFHGQRRMAMVDANMAQASQNMQPYQMGLGGSQQAFPPPSDLMKKNMPVQWNEVSSGTMETTTKISKQQLHNGRGNLAVVQQRHNFDSLQAQTQGLSSNQQVVPMSQNMSVQGYMNHSSQRMLNLSLQQQQRQGFSQPLSHQETGNVQPAYNGAPNPELQMYRTRTQMEGYAQVDQHGFQNGTRGMLQPRPPTEPRFRQHVYPNATQPSQAPSLSDLGQRHSNDSSEASPKRNSENPAIVYTAQIHMYEPAAVGLDASLSPSNPPAPSMASPGTNQVSSSTADSSTGRSGGAEHAQIDFDTMLDDGDHSSLMSGTLSPGLLQSLSQSSSRLTTPRNSVTLASVPAGISNMAIGDMSSMLTALAEESKFLNMIS